MRQGYHFLCAMSYLEAWRIGHAVLHLKRHSVPHDALDNVDKSGLVPEHCGE